jgi:hypothetical protein
MITVPQHPQNCSLGQCNFAAPCAMLNLEACRMMSATKPVEGPLHSAAVPARRCGTDFERGPSLQNLIANEILESLLTHSKQTKAIPSNREKSRVLRINKFAWGPSFRIEAMKSPAARFLEGPGLLIETFTNLEFHSTHSKNSTSQFSNRNKKRPSAVSLPHQSRIPNFLNSCRMRQDSTGRAR